MERASNFQPSKPISDVKRLRVDGSVGEDVPATFFVNAAPQSAGVIGSSVDATNTRYVVGGASIYLMNVSTGAYLAITPANWRIVLKGRC